MNITKELPHRFRESTFRRYEPLIAQALAQWPNPLVLPPRVDIAQETLCCGIRNAMRSLHENRWASDIIDMADFDANYATIEVARVGADVVVRKSPHAAKVPMVFQQQAMLVIHLPTNEEFKAAIILREGQRVPPVCFTGLTDDQRATIPEIEALGHVAFTTQPDGSVLLI